MVLIPALRFRLTIRPRWCRAKKGEINISVIPRSFTDLVAQSTMSIDAAENGEHSKNNDTVLSMRMHLLPISLANRVSWLYPVCAIYRCFLPPSFTCVFLFKILKYLRIINFYPLLISGEILPRRMQRDFRLMRDFTRHFPFYFCVAQIKDIGSL